MPPADLSKLSCTDPGNISNTKTESTVWGRNYEGSLIQNRFQTKGTWKERGKVYERTDFLIQNTLTKLKV